MASSVGQAVSEVQQASKRTHAEAESTTGVSKEASSTLPDASEPPAKVLVTEAEKPVANGNSVVVNNSAVSTSTKAEESTKQSEVAVAPSIAEKPATSELSKVSDSGNAVKESEKKEDSSKSTDSNKEAAVSSTETKESDAASDANSASTIVDKAAADSNKTSSDLTKAASEPNKESTNSASSKNSEANNADSSSAVKSTPSENTPLVKESQETAKEATGDSGSKTGTEKTPESKSSTVEVKPSEDKPSEVKPSESVPNEQSKENDKGEKCSDEKIVTPPSKASPEDTDGKITKPEKDTPKTQQDAKPSKTPDTKVSTEKPKKKEDSEKKSKSATSVSKSSNKTPEQILEYMDKTFVKRRNFITNEYPSIPQFKEKYPELFMGKQLLLEFQRITKIDIDQKIQEFCVRYATAVIEMARGKPGAETALTRWETAKQENETLKQYWDMVTALCLLPLHFEENFVEMVIEIGEDEEVKPQGKIVPVLVARGNIFRTDEFFLIAENTIVQEFEEFTIAFASLYSSYWVFNMVYPETTDNTYNYIQRCIVRQREPGLVPTVCKNFTKDLQKWNKGKDKKESK